MVVVDDHEREVPFELGIRLPHRLDEVAGVVALDEMRDHLRVGLRAECVAFLDERILELAEVLDDPVEDDGEVGVVTPSERMRILLGHRTVRRPARVSETVGRRRAVLPGRVFQKLQVADGAHVVERSRLAQHEPGGVVAAVLEPPEAVQQERLGLTRPDVADDPAHPKLLSITRPAAGGDRNMQQICRFVQALLSRNGKSPAAPRLLRRRRQPSSRRTRAAMLPQRLAASASSCASARTRTTGSVPDGLTSTRASGPWSTLRRSTSSRIASVSSLRDTGTSSLTCG